MNAIAIPTTILREPQVFWAELRAGECLKEKAVALLAVSVACFVAFGAIIGSSHSFAQALSAGVKLPILFLLTMLVCLPTLHILNLLFGSRHSLMQLLVLLLATLALTGTLLLAFAPVSAFFMMTTTNYDFIKVMNVVIFAVTAGLGVRFFYRGMRGLNEEDEQQHVAREKVLRIWILLYAFVGSQLAWTLRPFFGDPNSPFEIVRQVGGNFYVSVLESIGRMLGM
jgi:hypothetical protein